MRSRTAKPLLYALLLSLFIHLVFLLSPNIELSDWAPTPPLTVEIQTPPPAPPVAAPRPPPRPKPHKLAPLPAAPIAAIPETIETNPEPAPEPISDPTPPPQPVPAPEPTPPVAQASITTRQAFPTRIEIVYTVHRGDQGIKLGTTIHKWHIGGAQYLLTSTTEASGLFALFYSGRYVMTSKGNITPNGLQPTSFWIQRGQSADRTEFAEFNWDSKTLDYGKSSERHNVSISDGAQDQLSVFYQIALTAPHTSGLRFALTTGRKFNQYTYQVIGEETLDTALGKIKTQNLSRVTAKIDSNEGTDIWLAINYHYLPVRFRLATRGGEVLDHWIKELRVEGKNIEPQSEEVAQ